jgi:hypothetical protein
LLATACRALASFAIAICNSPGAFWLVLAVLARFTAASATANRSFGTGGVEAQPPIRKATVNPSTTAIMTVQLLRKRGRVFMMCS